MFISHIGAMDSFARGLRIAAKMKKDGVLNKMVNSRYKTFSTALGKKVENGTAKFEDFHKYVVKNGEPPKVSGK